MGIDFRGIRRRLQWRLHRFWLQATDKQIKLLRRGIDMLNEEDTTPAAELEALNQKTVTEWEKHGENALFVSVGRALSLWAKMEESLVVIAGILLRTKFTKAGAIMYSIINFNVWLSLIDELFVLETSQSALKPNGIK